MYTDGGPEHRSNFLSVKLAIIALQKFLDLDLATVARTSPSHFYCNPAKKINYICNLGLYGTGCMQQKVFSNTEFEHQLPCCTNLKAVR